MKKIVLIFQLFVIFSFFCSSQQIKKPDYIFNEKRILTEAKVCLKNNDYGKALKYLEDAKKYRQNKVKWEEQTLLNSFKPFDVKKAGDDLNDIIPVLTEREDFDALEIIQNYSKIPSLEKIDYSAEKLIEYIKNHKEFPEADFYSAKIYILEGEYEIAESILLKAYKNADLLDIPEQKYDILYTLSENSLQENKLSDYEKYLTLIISQDNAFNDKAFVNAMNLTIKSSKKDSLEKFFLMYRTENYRLLNAYFSLCEFYQSKNLKDKALNCAALGVITGFSKLIEVISFRNPEFQYNGLESVLFEVQKYTDVVEWGKDNNLWKGFNMLSHEAFLNQCSIFSMKLYSVLKDFSPEEYWKKDAEINLRLVTASN